MYKIIWNQNEIGEIFDLSQDMWYLDGTWKSYNTAISDDFERILKAVDPKAIFTHPEKGLKIILSNMDSPDSKIYCFALFIDQQLLSLRQVVSESALNMFFPNR